MSMDSSHAIPVPKEAAPLSAIDQAKLELALENRRRRESIANLRSGPHWEAQGAQGRQVRKQEAALVLERDVLAEALMVSGDQELSFLDDRKIKALKIQAIPSKEATALVVENIGIVIKRLQTIRIGEETLSRDPQDQVWRMKTISGNEVATRDYYSTAQRLFDEYMIKFVKFQNGSK